MTVTRDRDSPAAADPEGEGPSGRSLAGRCRGSGRRAGLRLPAGSQGACQPVASLAPGSSSGTGSLLGSCEWLRASERPEPSAPRACAGGHLQPAAAPPAFL